jgi:hypothetical protein|uniref:Mitochondrial resolvase Ydc2 catalytic domain-containing protein n=1 Tax=viral metagenome TaxID=1070528 RepID=A0A6C0AK44_9ZZZZ
MNLLSIDVGMKHLAYCHFVIHNKEYFISQWGVINLCKDDNIHCCGKMKNNKPCKNSSKYYRDDNYYCKIHAKKTNYKIPTKNLQRKAIKKLKVFDVKLLCDEMNIKYKKKEKKDNCIELINKYLDENYLHFVKTINTRSMNLVSYGRCMKEMFDEQFKTIHFDYVLVENQIGPLALRMKTLQGMIMQYFIHSNVNKIEEISPSNKLKDHLETKKTTYKERKKKGIEITREKLIDNVRINKWLDYFNKHKKKDDLADSYLQGLWYFNNILAK